MLVEVIYIRYKKRTWSPIAKGKADSKKNLLNDELNKKLLKVVLPQQIYINQTHDLV